MAHRTAKQQFSITVAEIRLMERETHYNALQRIAWRVDDEVVMEELAKAGEAMKEARRILDALYCAG